jgi:hypothetical protein
MFSQHLGGLNSSHFLPQAADFYSHYHALALVRAAECADTWEQIPADARDRLEDYVLQCEKEALVLEAVGHHFLQDAWSMGHMWERWGSSSLEDWDWTYPYVEGFSAEDDLTLTVLVGGFSGTIHGAKSVTDVLSAAIADWVNEMLALYDESGADEVIAILAAMGFGPEWLEDVLADLPGYLQDLDNTQPLLAEDPMCFPFEDDVAYRDPWLDERLFAGGDYTWNSFINEGGGPVMDDQLEALLGCSVSGIRQVYEATGMAHNGDDPVDDADLDAIDPSRTVDLDEACFDQRADNGALMTGFGIHLGAWPRGKRFIEALAQVQQPTCG